MENILITLTGSQKQITWANSIREEYFKNIESKKEMYDTYYKEKDNVDYNQVLQRAIEIANNHEEASWWIDNRNYIKFNYSDIMYKIKENIIKDRKKEEKC